jgi:hypothetical protein
MNNPNVVSVHLFLVAAWFAREHACPDVAVACIACWVAGLLNHSFACRNRFFSTTDVLVVNAIALYYVSESLLSVVSVGGEFWYGVTVLVGLLTLAAYVLIYDYRYHPVVHLLSFVGICSFVMARSRTSARQLEEADPGEEVFDDVGVQIPRVLADEAQVRVGGQEVTREEVEVYDAVAAPLGGIATQT